MGLPLAGKTTWIKENIKNFKGFRMVSADEIKERHPDYDPDNAEKLHKYSVVEAEKQMKELCDKGYDIVMDTGGINNFYTKRIIDMLKKNAYHIKLVHIKTPYNICLKRNKERVRKVPERAILEKAVVENKQFHRLKEIVDEVEVVHYHTNKYLFIDMDGVIAALSTLPIINGEIDFVNAEVHLHLTPVPQMIDKLNKLRENGHKIYILSAVPNSFSLKEKEIWLDKYFNLPKDHRFFVNQGRHKAEMLENLSLHLNIDKKDITMVDDIHGTLYDVKNREMNSMHVSEFLVHEF